MIDLSSQPTDDNSQVGDVQSPRHDAVGPASGAVHKRRSQTPLTHQRAEAFIEFISRWAGPSALILAVAAIGWAAVALIR